MKVIELLTKIANGKKVPKWVVYDKREYTYREEYKDYVHEVYNNGTMLFLLSNIFDKNGIDIVLNQELDFIEEDKKIEKMTPLNNVSGASDLVAISQMQWENNLKIERKINEIIDYLEENK